MVLLWGRRRLGQMSLAMIFQCAQFWSSLITWFQLTGEYSGKGRLKLCFSNMNKGSRNLDISANLSSAVGEKVAYNFFQVLPVAVSQALLSMSAKHITQTQRNWHKTFPGQNMGTPTGDCLCPCTANGNQICHLFGPKKKTHEVSRKRDDIVFPFFLISLEAHQTYSVNLKTIGGKDYRDLEAQ